jgi:hypothetical protein
MYRATKGSEFCCQLLADAENAKSAVSDLQKDIYYLRQELMSLHKTIAYAREQIIEQMDLAQGQRDLILTVAAALFIHMSFDAVSQPSTFGEDDEH